MKYIVSALLMLTVLALACFGCACYISMEVDMTEACLNQAAEACLLELTPQQGRLTLRNNRDFALSPHDLMKALYPASYDMEKYA